MGNRNSFTYCSVVSLAFRQHEMRHTAKINSVHFSCFSLSIDLLKWERKESNKLKLIGSIGFWLRKLCSHEFVTATKSKSIPCVGEFINLFSFHITKKLVRNEINRNWWSFSCCKTEIVHWTDGRNVFFESTKMEKSRRTFLIKMNEFFRSS